MKFGQYLSENLTPEWKRAYIDYRACKKSIKVIARRLGQIGDLAPDSGEEGAERDGNDSSADEDYGPSAPPRRSPSGLVNRPRSGTTIVKSPNVGSSTPNPANKSKSPRYGSMTTTPRQITKIDSNPPPLDLGEPGSPTHHFQSSSDEGTMPIGPSSGGGMTPRLGRSVVFDNSHDGIPPPDLTRTAASPELKSSEEGHGTDTSTAPLNSNSNEAGPSKPRLADKLKLSPKINLSPRIKENMPRTGSRSLRSMTLPSPRLPLPTSRTQSRTADNFDDLYDSLEADEKAFFDLLSRELEKVENFYIAREREAIKRAEELKNQLNILAEHRKIYHELYPDGLTEWEVSLGRMVPAARGPVSLTHKAAKKIMPFVRNDTWEADPKQKKPNGRASPQLNGNGDGRINGDLNAVREAMIADKDHKTYSPERYTKHKKELRGACQEFYRHLERIKNYRIMNMTGFRKALKKYEKTTRTHCMDMWTDQYLGKQAFSNGERVESLIKEMEDMYTKHFEHGDSKKARDKLRRQDRNNTHYTTIFRSGFMIGIGIPATIFALVKAMSADIATEIPAWNGLLIVYGSLYLPVIFAMLFELNLDAWVNARINYEFVMELSRPVLDFRSYLEIPAFLFATLSFCFYFTYFQVGASHIAPTSWPAIWLVFVAVLFLNPLPFFRRDSRYWFLRVLLRVITPGYSRVEFIAFFIADELNSLVYSIQNIYFLSCGYAHRWPGDIFEVCPAGKTWQYALLLCLPALARLIQCVKRWHDTRLKIHLVNAGKYLSSISQFCMFVVWRSRGSPYLDPAFFVWIAVAFIASTYTSSWDLIIDWSLFRTGSKGLRPDLGYRNKTWYYCAMVYNVVIRFVWIWYIPHAGGYIRVRSFFFALAEMLRRWIWNFFRVETEHLGNADAYRVTREIPLPYRRIDQDSDSDEPLQRTKSSTSTHGISLHLAKLRRRRQDPEEGKVEEVASPKSSSGYRQRQYEAWRPKDKAVHGEV